MSKNAGVSSILSTSEKEYFPILVNLAASAQNLIRTLSFYFGSFWLIEVRAHRENLCRVKNLSTKPRLAENNGL